jgi:hypothetical protein
VIVIVVMVMMFVGSLRRAGEDQLALMDAFEPLQLGGHHLEGPSPAAQGDHLEAVIVVEVDVHGRDHHLGVAVLQFHELFHQAGAVMVVDDRQCGGGVLGVL